VPIHSPRYQLNPTVRHTSAQKSGSGDRRASRGLKLLIVGRLPPGGAVAVAIAVVIAGAAPSWRRRGAGIPVELLFCSQLVVATATDASLPHATPHGATMAAKRSKPSKKSPVRKPAKPSRVEPLDDPDDEPIDISVHDFDCSMHPPNFASEMAAPSARRGEVASVQLVIKFKRPTTPALTKKFTNVVDAIFLTRSAREKWERCNPPSNAS
jgi:hypothetical protein